MASPTEIQSAISILQAAIPLQQSRRQGKRLDGPFNVKNFAAELGQSGILNSAKHMTYFNIPGELATLVDAGKARDIMMRCEASQLPDAYLMTIDNVFRHGIGAAEKIPFKPVFSDITTSYIMDGSGLVHKLFTNWLNFIINFNAGKGVTSTNSLGAQAYELRYKDSYTTTLSVVSYNDTADAIIQVNMRDAFPIRIDMVNLNWGNQNQFVQVNVTWAFTDWYASYGRPGSSGIMIDENDYDSGIRSILTSLQSNDATIDGQTFNTLRNVFNNVQDINNQVQTVSSLVNSFTRII